MKNHHKDITTEKTLSVHQLKAFTKALQNEPTQADVCNFYHAKRINLQRHNLERYLEQMLLMRPRVLLVGEAPGYNGCRLTGIPFTSEDIVFQGVCKGRLFGEGYRAQNLKPKKEQTATAMWSVLEGCSALPLLWNAFPFHPHKKDDPFSNRKPTSTELKLGAHYLSWLIELFAIQKVIAVGNVADDILGRMGIEHEKVRHPSYGGKVEFREQLESKLQYFRGFDQ